MTNAYTLVLMITSSVGRKTKFVSKIYKNVLISIMENLMPMHDCDSFIGEILLVEGSNVREVLQRN